MGRETPWALEQRRGVQIDEIRVITTGQGCQSTVRELLGEHGQFHKRTLLASLDGASINSGGASMKFTTGRGCAIWTISVPA